MQICMVCNEKVKASNTRYQALGPELIPVYRQSAHRLTIRHQPSGKLPLLSARPAVTFPAAEHHRPLAGTRLYWLTKAHRCQQLAQGCYTTFAPSMIWTHDLLIASPMLYPLHHCTIIYKTNNLSVCFLDVFRGAIFLQTKNLIQALSRCTTTSNWMQQTLRNWTKNTGSKILHHFVQRLLMPSARQQVAKPRVLIRSQKKMFKAGEETLLDRMHRICVAIWETGKWPEKWTFSMFIPLPKKGDLKHYSTDAMFDHIKYILSVCVWQTDVDYSLYIWRIFMFNKNVLNEYVQCVIGYVWFGPLVDMK